MILRTSEIQFFLLLFAVAQFGVVSSRTPPKEKFIKILETPSSIYTLSVSSANFSTAELQCQEHGSHLIALNNADDASALYKRLLDFSVDYNLVLTSGISYSNSTVTSLLIWNATKEVIDPSIANFQEESVPSHLGSSILIRNRREVISVETEEDENCECACANNTVTTPAPFTRPPCRKPICHIHTPNPPCNEVKPRECVLTSVPECKVKQNNCTVDCSEECRIVEQPRCTIKPATKPRCTLKQAGPCQTGAPNCTIVSPGECRSVQDKCDQDDSTCKPIIKPCKNPCSKPECQTTQAPCQTTQLPCITTVPSSCNVTPSRPDCKIERQCRKKRDATENSTEICNLFEMCPNSTRPMPIIAKVCAPETTCPPAVVTCPPPVTSCTRPFVDCSPEICQSSVQICLPPNIRCPPPRIICDSPTVKCDTPLGDCPTPEVECGEPEVECSKPKIECPDAIVHCDPIITTCGQAPVSCNEPEMECREPEVTCEEPVTCPPGEGGEGEPYSNCECRGKKCNKKKKRRSKEALLLQEEAKPDVEFVERIMCIALKWGEGFKWVKQSCNLESKFICQKNKSWKERKGGLQGLLDLAF